MVCRPPESTVYTVPRGKEGRADEGITTNQVKHRRDIDDDISDIILQARANRGTLKRNAGGGNTGTLPGRQGTPNGNNGSVPVNGFSTLPANNITVNRASSGGETVKRRSGILKNRKSVPDAGEICPPPEFFTAETGGGNGVNLPDVLPNCTAENLQQLEHQTTF